MALDISLRTKSSIITAVTQDIRAEIQTSLASLLKSELANFLGPSKLGQGSNPSNQVGSLTKNNITGEKDASPDPGKHDAGLVKGAGNA